MSLNYLGKDTTLQEGDIINISNMQNACTVAFMRNKGGTDMRWERLYMHIVFATFPQGFAKLIAEIVAESHGMGIEQHDSLGHSFRFIKT